MKAQSVIKPHSEHFFSIVLKVENIAPVAHL